MVAKRCLNSLNQIASKAIYILLSIVSLKILSNKSQIYRLFKVHSLPWRHLSPLEEPSAVRFRL